jgi:DNA-directed RNA polymerase subunit RPC12/RpoP
VIEFRCPQCSQLIQAKPASVGKVSNCPQCRSEIQVPLPRKTSPEPPLPDENPRSQDAGNQLPRQSEGSGIAIERSTGSQRQTSEERYPALIILSRCFQWLAFFSGFIVIITIVVLILSAIVADNDTKRFSWIGQVLGVFFSGFFAVLVQLSISELIKLFLDIERNTRNR